jgi:hypothetical protein
MHGDIRSMDDLSRAGPANILVSVGPNISGPLRYAKASLVLEFTNRRQCGFRTATVGHWDPAPALKYLGRGGVSQCLDAQKSEHHHA